MTNKRTPDLAKATPEDNLREQISRISVNGIHIHDTEAQDKILALISAHTQNLVIQGKIEELENLLCPISCFYGDNCKIEHTRIKKSYITKRIKELSAGSEPKLAHPKGLSKRKEQK